MEEKKHPILGKTQKELYQQMGSTDVITGISQKAQTALLELMFENLGESLSKSSNAANRLASALVYLNIIMTTATVVAAVIAVFQYFK